MKIQLEIKQYDPYIASYLMPGIYKAGLYSSTGKTYLANALKKYYSYGYNVYSVTYNDILIANREGRKIELPKLQPNALVIIDRYDMYRGQLVEDIEKLSYDSAVIIDTKLGYKISKSSKECDIEIPKSRWIVIEEV